jgi:hypothetical protein
MLSNPAVDEIVWNKTSVDVTFSISQNGAYGAGQFPWPVCGLIAMDYTVSGQGQRAVVPNGAFYKAGYIGCNSSVFPDNSYRMFHINGGPMQWNGRDFQNHRGIYMFDNVVNSDTAPYTFIPIDIRGQGVNRVRVTNNPAYIVFCAPMIVEGLSDPRDIYIGQFNDDFTQIVHATNISNSPGKEDVSGYIWLPSGLGIGGPDSVGLFAGDTSDTITPSTDSLCVTSPLQGSSYRIGDTIRIKWSDPGNRMVGGLVSLSTDNGKSWCLLTTVSAVLKTSPEWGDYPWVVPDVLSCTSTAPVSDLCKIKVSDYNKQNLFGESGLFSITN